MREFKLLYMSMWLDKIGPRLHSYQNIFKLREKLWNIITFQVISTNIYLLLCVLDLFLGGHEGVAYKAIWWWMAHSKFSKAKELCRYTLCAICSNQEWFINCSLSSLNVYLGLYWFAWIVKISPMIWIAFITMLQNSVNLRSQT